MLQMLCKVFYALLKLKFNNYNNLSESLFTFCAVALTQNMCSISFPNEKKVSSVIMRIKYMTCLYYSNQMKLKVQKIILSYNDRHTVDSLPQIAQ